jgi:hypothetical protein
MEMSPAMQHRMMASCCSPVGSVTREVFLAVGAGSVLEVEVLVVADVLPLVEEVELEEVVVVLLTVRKATSAVTTSASTSSKSSSD